MRRIFVLAAAATLAVTACGTDGSSTSGADMPPSSQPEVAAFPAALQGQWQVVSARLDGVDFEVTSTAGEVFTLTFDGSLLEADNACRLAVLVAESATSHTFTATRRSDVTPGVACPLEGAPLEHMMTVSEQRWTVDGDVLRLLGADSELVADRT